MKNSKPSMSDYTASYTHCIAYSSWRFDIEGPAALKSLPMCRC